jgi:hypothetical protein
MSLLYHDCGLRRSSWNNFSYASEQEYETLMFRDISVENCEMGIAKLQGCDNYTIMVAGLEPYCKTLRGVYFLKQYDGFIEDTGEFKLAYVLYQKGHPPPCTHRAC